MEASCLILAWYGPPSLLCGARLEFIAFSDYKSSGVILCLHKGGDVLHSKLISLFWRTGQDADAEKLVGGSGLIS